MRCAITSVSVSRIEAIAQVDEPVAQRLMILDDPVMDDGDAVAGHVRMRVSRCRHAVGGPSVWAIPTWPSMGSAASAASSAFTLPTARTRANRPPDVSTASPAES